jgi:hypothetical protein
MWTRSRPWRTQPNSSALWARRSSRVATWSMRAPAEKPEPQGSDTITSTARHVHGGCKQRNSSVGTVDHTATIGRGSSQVGDRETGALIIEQL